MGYGLSWGAMRHGGNASADPADAGKPAPRPAARRGPVRVGVQVGRGPRGRLPRRRHPAAALPHRPGHHRELPRAGCPGRPRTHPGDRGRGDRRGQRRATGLRAAAIPHARPAPARTAGPGRPGPAVPVRPAPPGRGVAAAGAVHPAAGPAGGPGPGPGPGPDTAVVPRRRAGRPGRQPGPRPGRHRRQAAGLGLLSGAAPGLDQGQEPPARRGRHLRLEARARPPRGHHRLAAARRLRRRAPAVRRARRNRVHPGHARRPEPPAAAPADRHQPVRHAGPGRARPRRALDRAAARRRGDVHRVDQRRQHAPPELARPSPRRGTVTSAAAPVSGRTEPGGVPSGS